MTRTEFIEWRDHAVTVELMKLFKEVREAYADKLVRGDSLGKEALTAQDVGIVKGLDFFLKAEFEGDEEDED